MSCSRNYRSCGGERTAAGRLHHSHYHYPASSASNSHCYASSPPSSAFASSTASSFGTGRPSPSTSVHHRHRHRHHSLQQQHHHQYDHQHHGHAHHRSSSPTRVNFVGSVHPASTSVRFSIDPRSISPGGSLWSNQIPLHRQHHHHRHHHPQQRRTCTCSPTTHPGSFRCSLHKNNAAYTSEGGQCVSSPNRLNERRSVMTNSLVRIGTVEGELVKRALAALIRPSSHQQRRKSAFKPKPSRLSIMSTASDSDDDAISLC